MFTWGRLVPCNEAQREFLRALYLSQGHHCLKPRRYCLLTPSSWTTCGSMGGSCRYGQCSRPALSSGATGWPRSSWIVLVSLDLFPSLPLPVGQCPGPER